LHLPIRAAEKEFVPADFISVQKATPDHHLAPHGGLLPIPGVPERVGEGMKERRCRIFCARDANTELLRANRHAIESRLGGSHFE